MPRVWANASACSLQVSLSCALLSQIVSLQYLSRSSLRRLAGFSCCIFLSYGRGDSRGPSVVFEAVDVLCQGPLHLSHIADYTYDFCPLPDPTTCICLSDLVCDVENTSFHFDLCDGKFVSQCRPLNRDKGIRCQ